MAYCCDLVMETPRDMLFWFSSCQQASLYSTDLLKTGSGSIAKEEKKEIVTCWK